MHGALNFEVREDFGGVRRERRIEADNTIEHILCSNSAAC
jgi:hypothetical protein